MSPPWPACTPVSYTPLDVSKRQDQGKLGHLDHSKLYFVIWTTTVWTLPGNLAIALPVSYTHLFSVSPFRGRAARMTAPCWCWPATARRTRTASERQKTAGNFARRTVY